MKRLISDEQLIDYVNGRLSRSENKRIREMIIENSEMDMLLNVTLANYESQSEYADFLLGKEEFVVPIDFPIAADKTEKKMKRCDRFG